MAHTVSRETWEANAKLSNEETREYLFKELSSWRNGIRDAHTFESLLKYVRNSLLPYWNKNEASVWMFSPVPVKGHPDMILAGTPGITIMRDFFGKIRSRSEDLDIPEHVLTAIFKALVLPKVESDQQEIFENRRRMEMNSDELLKAINAEIKLEKNADLVLESMASNYNVVETAFKAPLEQVVEPADPNKKKTLETQKQQAAPPPPPQQPPSTQTQQQSPSTQSSPPPKCVNPPHMHKQHNSVPSQPPDFDENEDTDLEDDDDPEVTESPQEKEEKDRNDAIVGPMDEVKLKQIAEERRLKLECAVTAENKRNVTPILSEEERKSLDLLLEKYTRIAEVVNNEKRKYLMFYACFIKDISAKISAEISSPDPINCSGIVDSAMITSIHALFRQGIIKRSPASYELYEIMIAKSFTFKAFYLYLYYMSLEYCKLVDSIYLEESSDKTITLARKTSHFWRIIDEITELSLILKYFWGNFVFKTLSGYNPDFIVTDSVSRTNVMAPLIAKETRTIEVFDKRRMILDKKSCKRAGKLYVVKHFFKHELIECSPFEILVRFCRSREQFSMEFQRFFLENAIDKEIVAIHLYRSRENPIKHIVLNYINESYVHEMWPILGSFDPALETKIECIQNHTMQVLKYGEEGAKKHKDIFLEMLNGCDAEIKDFISLKTNTISNLASLYVVFLIATYFARHEQLTYVDDELFIHSWADEYFLKSMNPHIFAERVAKDDEPFIAKVTGSLFILRKSNNEMVVSDIISIFYMYKNEVEKRNGILFNGTRIAIHDFLEFKEIVTYNVK